MRGERTDTFLGARYRRIVKRRGHAEALVAVACSILVITWHLITTIPTPDTRSSAPTGTSAISIQPARPATSSAGSRPSDTRSLSHPRPDRAEKFPTSAPQNGCRAACPAEVRFSVQHQHLLL